MPGPISGLQSAGFNGSLTNQGNVPSLYQDDFEFLDGVSNAIGPSMELYNKEVEIDEHPGSFGTTSMFNQYNVFTLSRIASVSAPGTYSVDKMYDSPRVYRSRQGTVDIQLATNQEMYRAPTASRIIAQSNEGTRFGFGKAPYSWADFLYCKYYGLIPNNNLVTLRRYPHAVYDNLHVVDEASGTTAIPVAQAVTWLGEEPNNKMSDVLKFSFGVDWEEIEPMVQDIEGNEIGFGAGIESFTGESFVELAGTLNEAINPDYKRWSGIGKQEQNLRRKAWTDEGPYWNQVYGPVNVVHKTHKRKRGVHFTNDIKLKFHYSLKLINGVNPRVAMLDVITNFLSLTYTNTKWWGGSARYFPNYDDPVLFFGDKEALMRGDHKGYMESVYEKLSDGASILSSELDKIWKDGSSGLLDNIKSAGKSAASTAFNMIMGKLARNSRPEFLSIRSLLSGDPIGEWHLTIGNPFNPIAVIGNLIIKDTEMEFNDVLGADDFPTEVTFTVTLNHARPRDKGDIESIFNYGQGRLTYSPLAALPSEKNTHNLGNVQASTEDGSDMTNALNAGSVGETGANASTVDANGNPRQIFEQQEEYSNYATSSDNKARITQRINTEWGSIYAQSNMLASMFSNKQYKN